MTRTAAIVLGVLALLATACGSDDDGDTEPAGTEETAAAPATTAPTAAAPATTAPAAEPVELRFMIWDENQVEGQQEIAQVFMDRNPGITIEIEQIGWADYWTSLQTAIAGGAAPDLIWMNGPNLPGYVANGSLLPLSDFVERDGVDLSPFPQGLVDLYTVGGELYGISKDYDTIGLYYNVAMFDEAGISYPDETWTWDDLKEAARALTTDDVWGLSAALWNQMGYFPMIIQNGGQILAEDRDSSLYGEPEACEVFEFLYSFHTEGLSPDQVTLDTTNQWELFPSERIAMMFEGSWLARPWADLDIDVEVAPLPMGRQRGNIIHGLAYAATAGTEHPEEAWEFLKFLATEEAHLIQAAAGLNIPSYAGTQDVWLEGFAGEMNVQVLLDAAEFATPFPLANAPLAWDDEAKAVLQDAFRGNIEFPDACAQAAEAAEKYITDNRFGS